MSDPSRRPVDHGSLALPWSALSMAGVLAGLYVLFGPMPAALIYDRAAISDGEVWRLITGHLVHTDASHFAWNLGAFVILGTILERELRLPFRRHVALLLSGAAVISAWLWWGMPQLARYCGISAVLNTQFTAVLGFLWLRTKSRLVPLVGLGAVLKIGIEKIFGTSLFVDMTWPSVPEAHLAGLAAGLLIVGWLKAGAGRISSADGSAGGAFWPDRNRRSVGGTRGTS